MNIEVIHNEIKVESFDIEYHEDVFDAMKNRWYKICSDEGYEEKVEFLIEDPAKISRVKVSFEFEDANLPKVPQ